MEPGLYVTFFGEAVTFSVIFDVDRRCPWNDAEDRRRSGHKVKLG
jgi:hypothetical protein